MIPKFLRRRLPSGKILRTKNILNNINTVCEKAACPNQMECFSKKTATFLACGNSCSRNCKFCNINHLKTLEPLDVNEPYNIAKAAKKLKLRHIVITMVTRDDLLDKGANHIAKIINAIKDENPKSTIEVLTSDFSLNFDLIDIVINTKINIFNYNIETIRRLTPILRDTATYDNSLKILKYVKNSNKVPFVKSGFMVGLGENKKEVFQTIKDLKEANCDIITIGQYFAPTSNNYPVQKYIKPVSFKSYTNYAKSLNVRYIYANSYVRSSYNSELIINELINYS